MLPSPVPQWVRDKITEVIRAYRQIVGLCENRCRQLDESDRRDAQGRACDDFGTIDDYRMDAKYCAGQAARLPPLLAGRLTAEEYDQIINTLEKPERKRSQEEPWDPRKLAQWAWDNPWKRTAPLPETDDALFDFRPEQWMQPFTQREAEALILTVALLMNEREAARVMETSIRNVRLLLHSARQKFGRIERNGEMR